jgi:DNA-binding HxlR family transcriptional regulator
MNHDDLSIEQQIKYMQDTLHVFGGKWKLLILLAIFKGKHHFRDIQRSVPRISSRVLSHELKDLEDNKLVRRTTYEDAPKTVVYSITPYCKTMAPVVEEMVSWGRNHRKKITGK